MTFVKYAVPVLAAIGAVYGQCSVDGTTTISTQAQATQFSSCQTFEGSIEISADTTDSIDFGALREIEGSLRGVETNRVMSSLTAAGLERITDIFYMHAIVQLNSINMPRLAEVGGLDFVSLNTLQSLGFGFPGVQQAGVVNIQDTGLNTLDGLNLAVVDNMTISNNQYLQRVSMQLGNVSQSLGIDGNTPSLEVELTNMIWANNMAFRDLASISLPSLVSVNESLGFFTGSYLNLTLSNLTVVGQALTVNSNTELTNISFPVLERVGGGLSVQNNTVLEVIDFPQLVDVGGAVDMYGAIEDISFPELNRVQGTFNLQSSGNVTCAEVEQLRASGVIRGRATCQPNVGDPGPQGSRPTQTSGSSGQATGASSANNVLPASIVGISGLFAAILML